MLLLVEKDITGGVCQSIYWYAKANNKDRKNYDKNKKLSFLQRYTNADLKISLYVCIQMKVIPWKFHILIPRDSQVTCP